MRLKKHKLIEKEDYRVMNIFLKFCALYSSYEDFEDIYENNIDIIFPFYLNLKESSKKDKKKDFILSFSEKIKFLIYELEDFLEKNNLNFFPKYVNNKNNHPMSKQKFKKIKDKFYNDLYDKNKSFDINHENFLKQNEEANEIIKMFENVEIKFGPLKETRKLFLKKMKEAFDEEFEEEGKEYLK